MSRIELLQRERVGGGGRTHRVWLDFVIDGRSLYESLALGDLIGCLGWASADLEHSSIRQLQRKEPPALTSGRVMLYVCAECGDLACGALAVRVERDGYLVVWRDFAFENGMTQTDTSIGPFSFNAPEYWETLEARRRESSRRGTGSRR